ncbi:MAG TPA: hypothetical protein DCF63_00885 [Planctomycetaceae bacterium]|nr:hypothetical protein [Planctomycetaceae bacterium]
MNPQTTSASESIADHAAGVIETYLTEVQRHMKIAVKPGRKSAEAVHQPRVFARRAYASLKVYEQWISDRQQRWFCKQLTRIRDVAGRLRDLDVLIERYQSVSQNEQSSSKRLRKVLPGLRKKRLDRLTELKALHVRLMSEKKYASHQSALLAKLKSRSIQNNAEERYEAFARLRIMAVAEKFVSLGSLPLNSLEVIHRFRIGAKKLRYTLEVLSDAFPEDRFVVIHKTVTRLQDLLGEINDCRLARRRLRKWSAKCFSKKLSQQLKSQLLVEQDRQKSLRKELSAHWNSQSIADFQSLIDDLLAV